MSQQPQAQAYQPRLPSIVAAQEDYTKVTSDHIPILASIPAPGKPGEKLKVLSWNVMEGDKANGFAPVGFEYKESVEQTEAKYERIAEGLAKAVKQNDPQFITLQEISDSKPGGELYQKIKEKLRDKYDCVSVGGEVVNGFGVITLYKKDQFEAVTLNPGKNKKDFDYPDLAGNVTVFQSKEDKGVKIRVLNSHADFNLHPQHNEAAIHDFLTPEASPSTQNTISIVVGDFNCTFASLDNDRRNITTSVSSIGYNNGKLQGAGAIDGCFYSFLSEEGSPAVPKRATIEHLDPFTGKPFTADQLKPLDIKSLPALQKKEITEFRMIMCVDNIFTKTKVIGKQYTIFQYQNYLREEFNDPTILVRFAKNLVNEAGVGITLSKDLFNRLRHRYAKDDRFQISELYNARKGQPYFAVFASEANFPALRNILDSERPCAKKIKSAIKPSGYGAITIASALIGIEAILTTIDKSATGKLNNVDLDAQIAIAVVALAIAAALTITKIYASRRENNCDLNFATSSL